MHSSDRGVALSAGAAVFLACAAVYVGVSGWIRGRIPAGVAIGAAMLAVGILASQRTMWLHATPTDAGALSNAGLFVLAPVAKIGGVGAGLEPLETVGEALFCIAVAYYLVRADGR